MTVESLIFTLPTFSWWHFIRTITQNEFQKSSPSNSKKRKGAIIPWKPTESITYHSKKPSSSKGLRYTQGLRQEMHTDEETQIDLAALKLCIKQSNTFQQIEKANLFLIFCCYLKQSWQKVFTTSLCPAVLLDQNHMSSEE